MWNEKHVHFDVDVVDADEVTNSSLNIYQVSFSSKVASISSTLIFVDFESLRM